MSLKEIEIVHIWEFAVEFMQIPIIVFIIFLSVKAIKVMKLTSLKWVYIAFIFNLIYLFISIWSSEYTPYLHFGETKFSRDLLKISFDIISSSLFYWAAICYWINDDYTHYDKFNFVKRLRQKFAKNVLLTKAILLIILILTSYSIVYFSILINNDYKDIHFRGLFNFFALIGMVLFFRQDKFIALGFFFWSLLQPWKFYPDWLTTWEFFVAFAFSFSMIAKGLILFGLFSKYCLLYTSPSPRDQRGSRMPSSA